MKAVIVFLMILFATVVQGIGQVQDGIEVEVDPLAYMFGGASGHIAYTWNNKRLQVGVAVLELPESFRSNQALSEEFKAVSLKWDYFFGSEDSFEGFFAGPVLDYLFLKYRDDQKNLLKASKVNAGLRMGYRFDLFKKDKVLKGLYLTPWVSGSYVFNHNNVKVAGESYTVSPFKIFPTIHLGWRI